MTTSLSTTESVTTPPAPDTDAIRQDRTRNAQEAVQRQAALDKQTQQTIEQENRELASLEKAATAGEQDLAALKPPAPVTLPDWKPKPVVDPHEFQSFSWGLLAMALVGGAVSRGNWLGVSSTLNGAMQGYLEGNKARADRELQNYQTQFESALAHDRQAQAEFEKILNSKTLSINSILAQIRIAAAKYQREDVRQAAEQRSIDAIWRQIDASDRSLGNLEMQHQRLSEQMRLGWGRLQQQSGGWEYLDTYGKWVIDQTGIAGDNKLRKELESRFGGRAAAEAINAMGKELWETGQDPRTLTQFDIDNKVQTFVQKQLAGRAAGVERIAGTLDQMQKRVTQLVQKINGYGFQPVNMTFNKLADTTWGSKDLSELTLLMQTLGREYVIMATMPNSNAQLHSTTGEWAAGIFDRNMNMYKLQGYLKAMNLDVATVRANARKQQEESAQRVRSHGITVPGPTAAPAPGSPPMHLTSAASQPDFSKMSDAEVADYIQAHGVAPGGNAQP
jgi:hypothetical protein